MVMREARVLRRANCQTGTRIIEPKTSSDVSRVTRSLAEQEIEREPDDEYNNDDTDSQESLCEILRDGGKGERADYQDDWEAELHEKKPSKVREYGKTGMMQQ